jgi:hypothetical protein
MTEVTFALCPGCKVNVAVFAHQLLGAVAPSSHAEVARALARAEGKAGERFAIAEADGSYRCPTCGRADWVPVSIDLD